MTLKQIALPDNTRRCFGRRRPLSAAPRLKLKNYLLRSMPSPPSAYGYMRQARAEVQQMYLNDQLGDCVEAAIAHAIGVFGAQNGARWIFSDAEITAMYSAMGGYVPGNPSTDQGTDIGTALSVWQKTGVAGPGGNHVISGSLSVDAADPVEYRTAIWLFENLILGLELPDAWISPFPSASGFVWDVAGAPDPSNGHCILATNYNPANVYIATWGINGVMTDAALQEYCSASNGGELYTVLSRDIINRARERAPNGFAWSQLLADFNALS